ncbi:hypothetical protein KEM48_008945 [Puccinia striiformis f. sp. tritici PST-130]|nr:hypothetical protein KEM48_008945 [Puccinia striiformis f. sp. tritici PST-130]
MMRFLHDPGPCFRHPLAYNSGTPICLLSTRLRTVVVPLLLSNMSSFNQTSSAHQHQNPPPYQQYQNHGYSLRPRAPRSCGRAPRSARPAVRTSPARRLGPVLRSVPARRGVIRQPFRGNRNSPVISPAISAVRGRYLDPISSPRIITVNRFVVSSSHRNPFLQHTPTQRLRMPVNAPEPEARPFSVARPALESLTNYLRPENADAGPAWVNPPTPRPHNLATPPSPLAPAGFDPSPRLMRGQRTSSASSGSAQSASSAESLTPSSLGSNSVLTLTMYLVSSYHLRNIITPSSPPTLLTTVMNSQLQIRLSSVLVSASSSACLAFELPVVIKDSLSL